MTSTTALQLLGLDHKRLTYYHDGIQRRLTDVHGEVIPGGTGLMARCYCGGLNGMIGGANSGSTRGLKVSVSAAPSPMPT